MDAWEGNPPGSPSVQRVSFVLVSFLLVLRKNENNGRISIISHEKYRR